MAIADSIALSSDSTFRAKIAFLVVKAAHAVMSEDAGAANHAARVELAKKALASPAPVGAVFAYGVVTNPAITAGSSDSDLEFTVNSLWDHYAGVST